MRVIQPQAVQKVEIISESVSEEGDELTERRYFLGYFDMHTSIYALIKEIEDTPEFIKILTTRALSKGYAVMITTTLITSGVIFDNAGDVLQCLRSGLTPNELYTHLEYITGNEELSI